MSKVTEQNKVEAQSKIKTLSLLLDPSKFTDAEKGALKMVFGDDPLTYKALRDLFFGFELDEEQKKILTGITAAKDMLRKIFLPEIKKEIPFAKTFDLWQTQDLVNASGDDFDVFYDAKTILLGMIQKSLERFDNLDLPGVDLTPKKDRAYLTARNAYIGYVDSQIRFIIQYVKMDSLTDAEKQIMFSMNSTK